MAEGNAFTNLLRLMKTQGYNKDVHITVGSVKSSGPLTIIIDSIEITEEDFIKTKAAETLAPNDKVLILIDGNNFYIIDKVVA